MSFIKVDHRHEFLLNVPMELIEMTTKGAGGFYQAILASIEDILELSCDTTKIGGC